MIKKVPAAQSNNDLLIGGYSEKLRYSITATAYQAVKSSENDLPHFLWILINHELTNSNFWS
jgi:hypothetical protein